MKYNYIEEDNEEELQTQFDPTGPQILSKRQQNSFYVFPNSCEPRKMFDLDDLCDDSMLLVLCKDCDDEKRIYIWKGCSFSLDQEDENQFLLDVIREQWGTDLNFDELTFIKEDPNQESDEFLENLI
eukprot:TRINITY_DN3655_c0_g1_i3.p3 TRINITY_DN3655_c0_g1~~TRINITY_DN3655_c0_g1_i3.p3  ORF type:complete len:127 (+),score=12.73 TRINITY_DN3655_c0_g1_i3:279-659(+)